MEPSLEMLGALFIVALVFSLALVVLLIRSVRKRRAPKRKHAVQTAVSGSVEGEADVSSPLQETREPIPVMSQSRQVEEQPTKMTPPSASAVVDAQLQQPGVIAEPEDVLLMRVWQDKDGVLMVEAQGQRYRRLYDIRDGVVGRSVLDTINRLVAFSKGQEVRTTLVQDAQPPIRSSPAFGAPEEVAHDQREAFLQELQQRPAETPRKSRISADPVPFRTRSSAQQSAITLNLGDEIEKRLQARVGASPEFSKRYIHVSTAPDGGLCFDVDGSRYFAVDEITDPEVQALIRAAISDWETKS